jgi:hypothetical protein
MRACTSLGMSHFEVQNISKASADQRAGRAGRVGAGHCYRLFSSQVYSEFEDHTSPEIDRMPIDGVVGYLSLSLSLAPSASFFLSISYFASLVPICMLSTVFAVPCTRFLLRLSVLVHMCFCSSLCLTDNSPLIQTHTHNTHAHSHTYTHTYTRATLLFAVSPSCRYC